MTMTRRAFRADARKVSFGNADRLTADGPIDRHSFPLVTSKAEALVRGTYAQGRKEEVSVAFAEFAQAVP